MRDDDPQVPTTQQSASDGMAKVPDQRERPDQRTAPSQPGHDVFVSYSSQDKPVADAIVSRLEQAGIRCWVAPRDVLPGMVWGEAILEAIETTKLMVVILSGQANDSHQVVREVERAIAHNVVVIPFRIESVEPAGALAYYLSSAHWLDAMTPPLESHIAQLVHVADAMLGSAATRPEPGPAPTAAGGSWVPEGETRPHRRGLIIGIVAAGAVVILGALAALLFASGGESPRDEQAAVEQPAMVKRTALKAGDCLTNPTGYSDGGSFWASDEPWPVSVSVVSCDQPHTAETVFVGDIWKQDAIYPGDGAVTDKADSRCTTKFEAYVGTPYNDSDFDFSYWYPNSASWRDANDRQVGCVAYDPDGRELQQSIKGLRQ